MKVLQAASGREWRGGQNQVRLLCRELNREPGLEQQLVTKADSELARRAAAEGVTVQGVAWEIGLDPRAWWQLRRAIAAFQPDIIHVHDSHALTLAATVAAGRRLVATRRVEFHIGRFGSWRRPDRVIAVSEAVKRVLVGDGIAADSIEVVPSGIDVDEVRRAASPPADIRAHLKLSPNAPVIVNAASLEEEKDQRTLIRAAYYARGEHPDLHWVIAGTGSLHASLSEEVARLGLGERVHLIGHVERIDALIAEASVFVLCSRAEGLGTALLNALALGRPVVATATGGIPELVPEAVLVPVGAAEALAHRVVDMLQQSHPIPFPERYTARAMAQGVLDVYRALL